MPGGSRGPRRRLFPSHESSKPRKALISQAGVDPLLGPPVERLKFGTLPSKKGERRALPGDLAFVEGALGFLPKGVKGRQQHGATVKVIGKHCKSLTSEKTAGRLLSDHQREAHNLNSATLLKVQLLVG